MGRKAWDDEHTTQGFTSQGKDRVQFGKPLKEFGE